MPQANTLDLEAFETSKANLDLISDKGRRDYYYPPPSSSHSSKGRHRERTSSLPTRPQNDASFHGSQRGREGHRAGEEDDGDSDPVERMRRNLERTTYLLSNLKVSLSKPEEIQILPPRSESTSSFGSTSSNGLQSVHTPGSMARHHSEPQKHSSSYYDSHPPPPPPRSPWKTSQSGGGKTRLVAPGMERSDSNATNTTAFSIAVSTYSGGLDSEPHDHGSEFHQIINHGRLHNPSRGSMLRRQAVMSTLPPPLPTMSVQGHHSKVATRSRLVEKREELREPREESKTQSLGRHPTPYPALSMSHDRNRVEAEPAVKIRSRPFPPSHLPFVHEPSPPPPPRGHGRAVSVSQPPAPPARKLPGMRRVRFDF